MPGLLHHMLLSLRLNLRSTQAMVYGYVFPIIFLFAFWAIYSRENPPLGNELGQLLTVTILSGACFGMPTAMVGGVGVNLPAPPNPARHVAAFLPGLYAVDALDNAIRPAPLPDSLPLSFCLFALTLIGCAGCLAGRMMFRWDAAQRMAPRARA